VPRDTGSSTGGEAVAGFGLGVVAIGQAKGSDLVADNTVLLVLERRVLPRLRLCETVVEVGNSAQLHKHIARPRACSAASRQIAYSLNEGCESQLFSCPRQSDGTPVTWATSSCRPLPLKGSSAMDFGTCFHKWLTPKPREAVD
jgi:hypothetical protein